MKTGNEWGRQEKKLNTSI